MKEDDIDKYIREKLKSIEDKPVQGTISNMDILWSKLTGKIKRKRKKWSKNF